MYYDIKNLPERDLIAVLFKLLVEKEVIRDDELEDAINKHIDKKNELLKEELDKNPVMKMMFDAVMKE